MEQKYLIDSNCIIYYFGNRFPANGTEFIKTLIDAHPHVSVITKIEVLGFNATSEDTVVFNAFMNDAVILELSLEIVNYTIELRKSFRIKLPDAIIAATALVNQMTLITRNTDDFKVINELQMVNPFLL